MARQVLFGSGNGGVATVSFFTFPFLLRITPLVSYPCYLPVDFIGENTSLVTVCHDGIAA